MSRVIRLQAENVLPLKAVAITPKGDVVRITGANDSGKTAILKCLWMGLGGKKEIPPDAIREGEDRGFVELAIGEPESDPEYTIRLNLRRKDEGGPITDSLTIKNTKGVTISSPMALLKTLCGFGAGQFDPLRFRESKPADQVAMLKAALGIDWSQLDQLREAAYEERTGLNRSLKEAEAQREGIPTPAAGTPDEEESIEALTAEYESAQTRLRENDEKRRQVEVALTARDAMVQKISQQEELVKNATAGLAEMEKALADLNDGLNQKVVIAQPLEDPNTRLISDRLSVIEDTNRAVRQKQERATLAEKINGLQTESAACTGEIENIDAEKRNMIAAADLPIEGLSFDEDGIQVNGHPFETQGTAMQLRIAFALAIAANPELRVITCDEAGALDDENLAALDEWAAANNVQIWLTGSRLPGEQCVEIREGEVVGDG